VGNCNRKFKGIEQGCINQDVCCKAFPKDIPRQRIKPKKAYKSYDYSQKSGCEETSRTNEKINRIWLSLLLNDNTESVSKDKTISYEQ
jgi:hypothetical protein